MPKKRMTFILNVVFLFLTVVGGSTKARAQNTKNPFAGNAEAIATGKATFEAVCAGYCHSTESSNRPSQCPSLFDCEWKNGSSDEEIFHTVTEGVPKTQMIGFKGRLPDDMLWKMIAYLRSASKCQSGKPATAPAH
jgi:mono/diheme cytochrome c family protein